MTGRTPPLWLQRLRADAVRAVMQEGESVKDTAALLNIDAETVHEWCAAAGYTGARPKRRYQRHDPDVVRTAIERVAAGERQSTVARDLGVRPQLVSVWCRGVQEERQAPRTQYLSVLVEGRVVMRARRSGDTVRLLGEERDVPWSKVERWVERESFNAVGRAHWQDGPAARRAA